MMDLCRTLCRTFPAQLFLLLGLSGSLAFGSEGYRKSLFNGRNLDGWVVTGCQVEVKDGSIFAKGGNG